MLQELLEKYKLKYEDLNAVERETLMNWVSGIAKNTITVEQIRAYIAQMKEALENDIAGMTEPKSLWDFLFRRKRDVYQRARLKNYLLLLAFLSGPEKAQKALEASLKNIKPKAQ